jgi:hypothetical protein
MFIFTAEEHNRPNPEQFCTLKGGIRIAAKIRHTVVLGIVQAMFSAVWQEYNSELQEQKFFCTTRQAGMKKGDYLTELACWLLQTSQLIVQLRLQAGQPRPL